MSDRRGTKKTSARNSGARSCGPVYWLIPLFLFVLTVATFLPVLQNGFVIWDDDKNLLNNLSYRGLGWMQLRWMFTTFHMSLYRPVTWITLGLDYVVWGLDPYGYHLTSLLLHALNALLLYLLTLRLFCLLPSGPVQPGDLGLKIAAGCAALFFAIHPLRVEPVAWASARNDILAGFFLLLAVICYLQAATSEKRGWWLAIAVVVYALSLLSKASAMMLPLVLLVLDIYPLRRLGPGKWFGSEVVKVWLEKIPFLLFGLGIAVIAAIAKHESGAMTPFGQYGTAPRLAQALYGLVFYLWKTLVPIRLSPLYELPAQLSFWDWRFIGSGVVVLTVTAAFFIARRRWPALLAGWACYVALLLPVLGLVQSGPQLVADRYSYLSCLSWTVLVGGAVLIAWRNSWKRWAVTASGGVLTILVVLTWHQARIWHDSESLWTHATAIERGSKIAHNNLGRAVILRGNTEEAIEHYRRSLQIDPTYLDANYNIGIALATRGDFREAVAHFREALRVAPDIADVHFKLANALAVGGDLDEAVEHYENALTLAPGRSDIYFYLGNVLVSQTRLDEAIENFDRALKINPDFAEAHNNLGRVLAAKGDLNHGIEHFRRALQIDPEFAEAHESLGLALVQQGEKEEARRHYEEALRILKASRQSGRR